MREPTKPLYVQRYADDAIRYFQGRVHEVHRKHTEEEFYSVQIWFSEQNYHEGGVWLSLDVHPGMRLEGLTLGAPFEGWCWDELSPACPDKNLYVRSLERKPRTEMP